MRQIELMSIHTAIGLMMVSARDNLCFDHHPHKVLKVVHCYSSQHCHYNNKLACSLDIAYLFAAGGYSTRE